MNLTTKTKLMKRYATLRKRVDTQLSATVEDMSRSDTPTFGQTLGYTVLSEGKRIRPLLAIEVFELFKSQSEHDIMPVACSLELLHASSLMLDDLPSMDNASMRRGKETAHVVFGESTTILASAALWTRAYELLSTYDATISKKLVAATAELTGSKGLIAGQYQDIQAKTHNSSYDELIEQYILKTASIFRLAVRMGAILGEAKKEQLEVLDQFACNLGVAFQIHDDIIDTTMSVLDTGKDAHLDSINHKQNIIACIGLDEARERYNEYIKEAIRSLQASNLDTSRLRKLIISLLS